MEKTDSLNPKYVLIVTRRFHGSQKRDLGDGIRIKYQSFQTSYLEAGWQFGKKRNAFADVPNVLDNSTDFVDGVRI